SAPPDTGPEIVDDAGSMPSSPDASVPSPDAGPSDTGETTVQVMRWNEPFAGATVVIGDDSARVTSGADGIAHLMLTGESTVTVVIDDTAQIGGQLELRTMYGVRPGD